MNTAFTDTRPAYVEEWLETLPYTDFDKTTALLIQALSHCNQQELKAATRFELLELYLHPYEYLLETWVKSSDNSSSLESRHRYIEPLKQIAGELHICSRNALDTSMFRKTRWINNKPPTQGILIAMRLVSHQLLMLYQAYAPVPKTVWRELHELYLSAESLRQLSVKVIYPVGDVPLKTSIEHAYKQILATSLVDPHHLPFGAIWEIYDQLDQWADEIQIKSFYAPQSPSGLYMLDIAHGTVPYSLSKYKLKQANPALKIINCLALQKHVQLCQKTLDKEGKLPSTVRFSALHARTLITQLQHAYGIPVKRKHPRKTKEGSLRVASGLNTVYYYLNNMIEFNANQDADDDEIMGVDNIFSSTLNELISYDTEDWSFINESAGGFSILKNLRPGSPIRIGDLVAINMDGDDDDWLLGSVRWLMVKKRDEYKTGIQTIALNPRTVAVRATSGGKTDTDYRRAFISSDDSGSECLITPRGLFMKERDLEININNKIMPVQSLKLLESTIAYEKFTWIPGN